VTAVAEPRIPQHLEPAACADVLTDESDLVGLELRGDAIGVHVSAVSIEESSVAAARLTSARIDRVRLTDVEFSGCDLSGALFIEPVLRRVRFRDCRMSGTAFELADLHSVQFVECRMDTVGLSMAKIQDLHVQSSNLSECSLCNASIERGAIVDSQLIGADLGGLRSTGLRLHGSDLSDLKHPEGLRGSSIDAAQMVPLAVQLLDAIGIEVTEDDGPLRLV
jgi:uncharacterized protein YjbI with pentapeptide repeats